jgi:hypothetical protein
MSETVKTQAPHMRQGSNLQLTEIKIVVSTIDSLDRECNTTVSAP